MRVRDGGGGKAFGKNEERIQFRVKSNFYNDMAEGILGVPESGGELQCIRAHKIRVPPCKGYHGEMPKPSIYFSKSL